MPVTEAVVTIQDLLDRWRQLGSQRLLDGTELIGRFPDVEPSTWMHVLFAGLDGSRIRYLSAQLGAPLPRRLRELLRLIGGMTLFAGAFRVAGWRPPGIRAGGGALEPDDLLALNHELDVLGWKPAAAVAFAVNAHDCSVHLVGMLPDPDTVVRCDRATGTILESHDDVFACLADRLTSLDGYLD